MSAPVTRLPWPAGFPNVVTQRAPDSPVRLKDQPGDWTAKTNDTIDAAYRVVQAMMDPSQTARLRAIIGARQPVIVAVRADEGGVNALPIAYAEALGAALGFPVDDDIVQVTRTFRSGAGSVHRLLARAEFDGRVQAGQDYVIVDDDVAQGGTLADLRSFIEWHGGHVIAASTLIGAAGSQVLALTADTLSLLRDRFGVAETDFRGAFGHGYDGLTESEARAILGLGTVDAFRDRVIEQSQAHRASAAGRDPGAGAASGVSAGRIGAGAVAPAAPPVRPGNLPPIGPQGGHRYRVRVYYEDTDAAGVVYYANYLKLAERARTEALRDGGIPHAELTSQHGLMFMVRRAKLDYLKPARLDDSLIVATQTLAVGAASVELRQSFLLEGGDGRALVVADLQLACVRQADMRAARIPPRWRDALAALSAGGAEGRAQGDAGSGVE